LSSLQLVNVLEIIEHLGIGRIMIPSSLIELDRKLRMNF
jgi:hypothetical protein